MNNMHTYFTSYSYLWLVYYKMQNTYFSGGYRGNMAADELNNQGFDAVTIEGGYSAWKDGEGTKRDNNSIE
jgi:hypothetical protein